MIEKIKIITYIKYKLLDIFNIIKNIKAKIGADDIFKPEIMPDLFLSKNSQVKIDENI